MRYKIPLEIEIFEKRDNKKCMKCGHVFNESDNEITVQFSNPDKQLSIFEAELLFMVFKENRLPMDYARYHTCPAGKEFIECIGEVK